jgi:hypothetical protein
MVRAARCGAVVAACLVALLACMQGGVQAAVSPDLKPPATCPSNCLACGERTGGPRGAALGADRPPRRLCGRRRPSRRGAGRSGTPTTRGVARAHPTPPPPTPPPTHRPARVRGRSLKKYFQDSGRRLLTARIRTVCTLCDAGYKPNRQGTQCVTSGDAALQQRAWGAGQPRGQVATPRWKSDGGKQQPRAVRAPLTAPS